MKEVIYRDSILARNSDAYVLWDIWQKAKSDRNKYQKKLDDHMKQMDQNAKDLMTRYDK
jgi:hypothetical protein